MIKSAKKVLTGEKSLLEWQYHSFTEIFLENLWNYKTLIL